MCVLFFFFNSVLRPFQDYFSSCETGQSVGGPKREKSKKNHLAHPQAKLGLSHMWPERGSNPHQTQRYKETSLLTDLPRGPLFCLFGALVICLFASFTAAFLLNHHTAVIKENASCECKNVKDYIWWY